MDCSHDRRYYILLDFAYGECTNLSQSCCVIDGDGYVASAKQYNTFELGLGLVSFVSHCIFSFYSGCILYAGVAFAYSPDGSSRLLAWYQCFLALPLWD